MTTPTERAELPVVAWSCEWPSEENFCWQQYHDLVDPLPTTWDSPPSSITPLADHATATAAIQAAHARIAELERSQERFERNASEWRIAAQDLVERAEAAEKRLEAYKADARRYHVLRDDPEIAEEVVIAAFGADANGTVDWSQFLDEWCDDAIASQDSASTGEKE